MKVDITQLQSKDLKFRYTMFQRIPSGTNMVLLYNLMETVFLHKYGQSEISPDDKMIAKFEKCKNLALSTNYIPERKTAVETSYKIMMKMLGEEE